MSGPGTPPGVAKKTPTVFPPDGGHILPEVPQLRKTYTWSAFVAYLDSLELSKNWRKYEEQGFRRCAVFDADGTIWKGDLSVSIMRNKLTEGKNLSEKALPHINEALKFFGQPPENDIYLGSRKLQSLLQSGEAFKIGQAKGFKKEEILGKFLGLWNYLLANYPIADLHGQTKEFFNSGFSDDVFVGIKEIVTYLHERGFEVYVLSAGVHQIVEEGVPLAGLGFKRGNVRGTKSTEVDGKMGEEIIPPILDSKGKAETARSLCQGKPFIAFGDSVDGIDAGMLEGSKIAVAVEPERRQAEVSYDRGYIVLDIERTVGGKAVETFTNPDGVEGVQ